MVRAQRNGIIKYTDCLYRKPYFDPDMLIFQIMDDGRKQIEKTARKRIKQHDTIPRIPLGNDKFPLRVFVEFFSFLKSNGIKEIDRVYAPRDYSRLKRDVRWIWNDFSSDAVKRNIKIFFDNLPKVYADLVSHNFPEIKEELPLFEDVTRVIVIFNVREEYKSFQDSPKIQFFYLNSENQDSLEIEVYKEGENKELPKISDENFEKDVKINGRNYKLISMSIGILDFIYEDLPMFNFVYKILEENLKRYFNSLKRGS